ncbi:arylamine N-acetyltransferase, partial [candidate division KSB1 bacterium]|nr:arylamine N-acetyltransferase [candidate division KSB1 bacterium]
TCYSSNPFLQDLLSFWGYETCLLGADMDNPNVHTCIRARLDSHQYHIDVGYAAPFIEPIRLDRVPYEIKHGKYTYRLRKIVNVNKYGMEVLLNGQKIHGYTINEIPRNFDYFTKTIRESFMTGNVFMSCIRITRVLQDRIVELKNRTLTTYIGGKSYSKVLGNIVDIETAVKNELVMPKCPIKKAIEILEEMTQKSFYEDEDYPEEY